MTTLATESEFGWLFSGARWLRRLVVGGGWPVDWRRAPSGRAGAGARRAAGCGVG